MRFEDIQLPLQKDARLFLKELVLVGAVELLYSDADGVAFHLRDVGVTATLEWDSGWQSWVSRTLAGGDPSRSFCSNGYGVHLGPLEELMEWVKGHGLS